jgi:hypothetical protein
MLLRARGGGPKANFLAFIFCQGHYLPYGLTPQYQLRSLITQGAEEGGLLLSFQSVYFLRLTIYPATLTLNISRGKYVSCNINCLVLAFIKAIIHIRLLSFCHDREQLWKFSNFPQK